jgi:uncharacterized protein YPO0396
MIDELYRDEPLDRCGFRLHKLEVKNWGTFDSTAGQVYTVRPNGKTALLIGQNGTGKSTLVDALLTLLVKPVTRNYNVAAGSTKQERNERSYVKGAFDRRSRAGDHRADVQYMRPDNSHYSVLLACFRDEVTNDAFTIAQVLFLNAAGAIEKVYCFVPEEKSIAADCAGLVRNGQIRQQLRERGFRTTARYKEYAQWLRDETHVKPKAMDMFNQTIAVKDIQSLTKFIRQHMLEPQPWNEKVECLLNHFAQLSQAHQSLVRVRRQFQLLEPIATLGSDYQKHASEFSLNQQMLDAADAYFRARLVDLFLPQCGAWQKDLQQTQSGKQKLGDQIAAAREEVRRLTNEMELAGGERLRQIPLLIEKYQAIIDRRCAASERYHEAIGRAGISVQSVDRETFLQVHAQLPGQLEKIEQEIASAGKQRDQRVVERGHLMTDTRDDQRELEALQSRQGNLPEHLSELRHSLCGQLQLPEEELPFVAELIAVKPEQRQWEASLEMVLRGFALSLLVPHQHYRRVSQYIEQTRLVDERGRGSRLVYLHVGQRVPKPSTRANPADSLIGKLEFRPEHPLLSWVQAELQQRFDYRCCETVQEFQAADGLALTRKLHVKIGNVRHEKDDRQQAADPRRFVLGWNNRDKRRHLTEGIKRLGKKVQDLTTTIHELARQLDALRTQQAALVELQRCTSFDDIDEAADSQQVKLLLQEKKQLESENDTVRLLKKHLKETCSRETKWERQREQAIKQEGKLESQIEQSEQLIALAQRKLAEWETDGTLTRHAAHFAELESFLTDRPLTAENLLECEQNFVKSRRRKVDQLRKSLDPKGRKLLAAMNRFLREFQEERHDLEADFPYLDSFLDLLQSIREDDLPRHERRFKDRLNEKVVQEIGILNGALNAERTEIESKIESLNQSLRQLEYRPGTHMKLEAKLVRDREITEFRQTLGNCLEGSFGGVLAQDEARYVEIEKLVVRLREEERWRNKVTDVRRWFDFAAREIDCQTGDERSYYEDSSGQSGGEKAKLAFTILVAAIAYQYDLDPDQPANNHFHFVVVDEMFSKVDDQYAEYALELFEKFNLQLLIVAPLDAKARVTESYVGCYLHVVKDSVTSQSAIFSITAEEFEQAVVTIAAAPDHAALPQPYLPNKPR